MTPNLHIAFLQHHVEAIEQENIALRAVNDDLVKALQDLFNNGHLITFTGDTPEDAAIKSAAIAALAKATK